MKSGRQPAALVYGKNPVLEALRANPTTRPVPVVILSNYNEKELVERGAKLGALDHLIKSQTTPAKLAGGLEGWLKT